MGARTNAQLKYSDGNSVFIYSHWGGGKGGSLHTKIHKAIARKQRWDDEMYMAAIIIREVLRDNLDQDTGYGVQPYLGEESYSTTVIDLDKQTIDDIPFQTYLDQQAP